VEIIHRSPIDEKIIFETPQSSFIQIDRTFDEATESFELWSSTSKIQRSSILRNVAESLKSNRVSIAELVRQETGKPLKLSLGEVDASIEMAFVISAECYRESNYLIPSAITGREILVERVPFGVAALIVSYNTPFPNFAWKVFPALMAGNSVILKPSVYNCESSQLFLDILLSSGLPKNVVNLVFGGAEVGNYLIKKDVDLISFTGSSKVGLEIQKNVAPRLIKSILELGGSNPIVITKNTDLDKAIPVIFESAFSNAGQRCAAGSRLIIHETLIEKFYADFGIYCQNKVVGSAVEADIGPLISLEAKENFELFLYNCEVSGARVSRYGKIDGDSANTTRPALIAGLDPNNELAHKEIFAPGLRVFAFRTIEEAINLANMSNYGLTAAVWSEDLEAAKRLAKKIKCGVVNINGPTHGAEPSMPFGGMKNSGNGTREAGIKSVEEYSDTVVTSIFRNQ